MSINSSIHCLLPYKHMFQVDSIHFLADTRQVGWEELLGKLTEALSPPGVALLQGVGNALEDEAHGVGWAQHDGQTNRYGALQA